MEAIRPRFDVLETRSPEVDAGAARIFRRQRLSGGHPNLETSTVTTTKSRLLPDLQLEAWKRHSSGFCYKVRKRIGRPGVDRVDEGNKRAGLTSVPRSRVLVGCPLSSGAVL